MTDEVPGMADRRQRDSRFATLDRASEHAIRAGAIMDQVLTPLPSRVDDIGKMNALFLMSAGARAKGLHAAIVRETGWDNPHAVYPLLRTLVDLVLNTMEVRRNRGYVYVVANDPAKTKIGKRRKRPQALIAAAIREVPDMKDAWDLLSEMGTHFGWAAFQTPLSIERTSDGVHVTASTGPGWSEPAMKITSLRHVTELTESMAGMIREIADADSGR